MGELEEDMRRAFHGNFKKDIGVKEEIGVMHLSAFDEREGNDITFEGQVHGLTEYSHWEKRNN